MILYAMTLIMSILFFLKPKAIWEEIKMPTQEQDEISNSRKPSPEGLKGSRGEGSSPNAGFDR
jgi:hypothetical protein